MTMDLAINNGLIVNAGGVQRANVGIRDNFISTICTEPLNANKVIDASDCWVLPGVIDPHVHFALKQGQGEDATETEDDYVSGPRAAAVGGVTTFIDFAISPRDQSPIEFLKNRMEMAAEGSCIDYGFHAGITNPNPVVIDDFKTIVDMGIPSFKFFVTYKDWGFGVDLGFLAEAMTKICEMNGVVCVHAENDEIVEFLRNKLKDQPELINHSRSRPVYSEEISVSDLVILAHETGVRLYIVHLTTRNALEIIRKAQNEGISVHAETCPHYLTFTDEIYHDSNGILYTMTPPLRPPGHKEALWEGLSNKSINVVSSDHNALSGSLKRSRPHWLNVPPGLAGTEMLLTFLHSEGVVTGKLEPERMVELLSANPAKLFGIPQKGSIEIGYDADIVIFNPEEKRKVQYQELATKVDFSIFEGMEMIGWPTHTISRGEVIVENGNFIGDIGRGKFIKRKITDKMIW